MKLQLSLLFSCLAAALVRAQTVTVTDAAGNSIIEVIMVDPQGAPVTSTLQTIPPGQVTTGTTLQTTTTTTPAAPIPTPPVQQGPVGQPAPTQTGQTTFQFTTTDANGDTIVSTDTFTPSFPTTQPPPTPTLTGTILNFSQWLNSVGTNTVPVSNAALERWHMPGRLWGFGSAMAIGAMGGAWLIVG